MENENWDYFTYYHRVIQSKQKIFFAGWLNLSHDLEGNRINISEVATTITCNIFTKNDKIHILLGIPEGESQKSYSGLFEQFKRLNEPQFITVINNIIAVSGNSPLLVSGISTLPDLNLMKKAKNELGASLKIDGNVFDLLKPRIKIIFPPPESPEL